MCHFCCRLLWKPTFDGSGCRRGELFVFETVDSPRGVLRFIASVADTGNVVAWQPSGRTLESEAGKGWPLVPSRGAPPLTRKLLLPPPRTFSLRFSAMPPLPPCWYPVSLSCAATLFFWQARALSRRGGVLSPAPPPPTPSPTHPPSLPRLSLSLSLSLPLSPPSPHSPQLSLCYSARDHNRFLCALPTTLTCFCCASALIHLFCIFM